MKRENHKCVACGAKASGRVKGVWYCNKHWQRMYYNGTTELKGRKRTTTLNIVGDIGIITTRKGEKILIDARDAAKAMRYSWCISKTGYAVANINGHVRKMHRYIMDVHDVAGVIVDHRNGDRLDNRRENLRFCTLEENARNKGRIRNASNDYPGVNRKSNGKYRARITVCRQEKQLGTFDTLEEAIAARKKAECEYHGEYAQSKRGEMKNAH